MSKIIKTSLSILMIVAILATCFITASANASYNSTQKVSWSVACTKPGYTFTTYKVGSVVKTEDPYEIKYTSNIQGLEDALASGNTSNALALLDATATSSLGSPVDTFTTSESQTSKNLLNKDQGVYYIKATSYPAGVKTTTNSVFALPYYDSTTGWIYSLDQINLASKVVDEVPEILKNIVNSNQDNENFTDAGINDEIQYEIISSVIGSTEHKLSQYVITDTIDSGLSIIDSSISVREENESCETIRTFTRDTDYTVTYGANGVTTIAFTQNALSSDDIYHNNNTDAHNFVTTYSATVNENASTENTGNKNTATSLTYANEKGTTASINGNSVYVYTYKIRANKFDDDENALSGATFSLYLNENDANNETNAYATGVSQADGSVIFKNTSNNEVSLKAGTYYLRETEAPEGFSRYGMTIPVEIEVSYYDTENNGTYIEEGPEHGIVTVDVYNSKVVLPQTGGKGTILFYALAGIALLGAAILLISRKTIKSK